MVLKVRLFCGLIFTLTGAFGFGSAAWADDGELTEACQACHGPDGVSRWGDIPNISGLPEVVIENAMYDFRGRARPCRKSTCAAAGACQDVDMCELAGPLTDEQIELLAAHYAARPFSPSVADVDPALVEVGLAVHDRACERCHTSGGSDPLDEASILRGQNIEYMRNAMGDYRHKRREAEAPMVKSFERLTDDEVEALLHFYASPTH